MDPGPQANNPPVAHGDSSYLTYYQHEGQKKKQQNAKSNKKQQPAKKPAPRKKPSPEARLAKLKKIHDKGLITDEEYAQRKAQILVEI